MDCCAGSACGTEFKRTNGQYGQQHERITVNFAFPDSINVAVNNVTEQHT